jgi:ribosomal protein S12 methylthiotransferase
MTLSPTLKEHHAHRIGEGLPRPRIAVVNLGCVRNTVDSQSIIGGLKRKGHDLASLEKAEAVIINTCAFVDDAKQESINAILELLELKERGKIKKVIVAGCLAQRYGAALVKELPGVDAFVGVQSLSAAKLQASPYLTPAHYAYVKICESCFNACSFCVIPRIKGKFVSRAMEAVLADVKQLAAQGVGEINIIGQDVTAYGIDIYGRKALPELLKRVAEAVGPLTWVRLLYMHPRHMTEELLEVIAGEPRICKYLDMPLQHVSTRILKAMNRGMSYEETVALVKKVRRKLPGAFLRTTFIVGFPGETEEDFEQLLSFIKDHPFERVGVFMYSREEGTAAYDLPHRVPVSVAKRRYDKIMEVQQEIAVGLQQRLIGTSIKVLIEERVKDELRHYTGRSQFDAPDVDGAVHVMSKKPLAIGRFTDVRVTGAMAYDLQGEAE